MISLLPSLSTQAHLTYDDDNKISLVNLQRAFSSWQKLAENLKTSGLFTQVHHITYIKMRKKFYDVYVKSKQLEGRSHRFANEPYVPNLALLIMSKQKTELAYLNDDALVEQILNEDTKAINDLIAEQIAPLKEGLYAPQLDGVQKNKGLYL